MLHLVGANCILALHPNGASANAHFCVWIDPDLNAKGVPQFSPRLRRVAGRFLGNPSIKILPP